MKLQSNPSYRLPTDVQTELAELARLMSDSPLHRAAWVTGQLFLRRAA
jgi:hypothetical protein